MTARAEVVGTLTGDCGNFPCSTADCSGAVKQYPIAGGRWFITMGHCGFNSRANNGNGYATKALALAAVRHFQLRGARVRAGR